MRPNVLVGAYGWGGLVLVVVGVSCVVGWSLFWSETSHVAFGLGGGGGGGAFG